jgi:DNA-directed RNA polymerase subunit RPC12/RpoP
MSEASLNKFDCLDRAKTLMAAGDAASLRYACLELRFCIEAVTYDKRRAYASRLPPDVLSIWQPPQVMKALIELEGEAKDEYIVAIGRMGSSQPMQVMGKHRTFGTRWLRKHYNKLGSYLHVRNAPGQSQVDPQELRSDLESVVEECARVVESSLTLTLDPGGIVEYDCQLCGRKTVANKESAKRRGRVSCLKCEAEHLVSVAEDQALDLRLSGWVFPCQACSYQILVPSKHLVPDYEFACDVCGHKHKLVKDWYYAVEVERGGEA